MSKNSIFPLVFTLLAHLPVAAQDEIPSISPIGVLTSTEEIITDYSGDAPLEVLFKPEEENVGSCTEYYEWRFYKSGGSPEEPYLIRHEKETTYTFTEAGSHCVALYAVFTQGNDTIARYTKEYWADATPITIIVSDSKLEMPNAFSPNGDGVNDIYKAKEGYRSIVSFKATIYNRWGQKLYSWDNVEGGWDGTFHGSVVKDGVYFVSVEARGADGRVYKIKRDVNVLKGLGTPSDVGGN